MTDVGYTLQSTDRRKSPQELAASSSSESSYSDLPALHILCNCQRSAGCSII